MQNKWVQSIVVLLSLMGMGELMRFPQVSLTEELQETGFIQERISSEKQLKLGQTGAAVALGGLRSLVAAFMNLQAFAEYEKEDWVEVERLFDIIVTLQPRNSYYWETGAWHMGYNAYFDYQYKLGMAAPRKRQKQKEYLSKSEQFLLRGVAENPEQVKLWQLLGRLFSDPHKPYDFAKAAVYLEEAAALENVKPQVKREYFYTLGRVPGREAEALELGKELMADPANNRFSSLRSQFYALNLIQNPLSVHNDQLINQIWRGDKKQAYRDIANYWCRIEREKFFPANVELAINRLQQELGYPDEYNPVKNPKLRRVTGQF